MNAHTRLLGVVLASLAACAAPAGGLRGTSSTAPRTVAAKPAAEADLDAPAHLVVRTEREWAALWDRMYSGRGEKVPPRPAVDFRRQMVLVATLGPRPAGHAARISDVAIEDGVLEAAVVERRPGPRCAARGDRVAPTAIATVPRFEGPVRFAERVDEVPCR